jgi:hypothetical protein
LNDIGVRQLLQYLDLSYRCEWKLKPHTSGIKEKEEGAEKQRQDGGRGTTGRRVGGDRKKKEKVSPRKKNNAAMPSTLPHIIRTYSFLFILHSDFLEGDNGVGGFVAASIHLPTITHLIYQNRSNITTHIHNRTRRFPLQSDHPKRNHQWSGSLAALWAPPLPLRCHCLT